MTLRARKFSLQASFLAFTIACSNFCSVAYSAESTEESAISNKIRILNDSYARRAERIYQDSLSKTSTLTVQELGNTALYFCMSQKETGKIEHLLRTEFGAQMMDDTYPSYGRLPSRINSSAVTNVNSLELGCQAIGPILIGYENRLSPAFKKWLDPHLKAAMLALRKQDISVKNTSACLIKAVDLILIGAANFDGNASYEGSRLLDDWIAYTKLSGIHEFNSPQAYEQDLNALNMGYLFAPDKLTKSKFKAILDYFWQDISAHYYTPTNASAGAHSRDYDLFNGAGALDTYAALAGINKALPPPEHRANEVFTLLNAVDSRAYRPSKIFLDLANTYPRTVECRWDDSPANDTYTYVTREYSLGSASGGDFGTSDKMLTARFSKSKNPHNITFSTVLRKNSEKDDYKHSSKINEHILNEPYTVQSQNQILALLKIDTTKISVNDELSTEFIFPDSFECLRAGDHKISQRELNEESKSSDIAVQEGGGAFALKIFKAENFSGESADIVVVASDQDRADGIFKLKIKHGLKTKSSPPFLTVGFIAMAEHCADDDALQILRAQLNDAKILQRTNATGWQVDTQIGKTLLTINRDFARPAETTRFVNGIEVQSPVFSVNGTLLGPSMWRREDAQLQRQSVSE